MSQRAVAVVGAIVEQTRRRREGGDRDGGGTRTRARRDAAGGIGRGIATRTFEKIPVPTDEREAAAGVPEEYRARRLIERAGVLALDRPKPLEKSSVEVYKSCWRRWMVWAFDDWFYASAGGAGCAAINPYAMREDRVARFVQSQCVPSAERGDSLAFTSKTLKNNRSAMKALGELFAEMDEERLAEMRNAVAMAPAAERRHREVELEEVRVDISWRLAWPSDVAQRVAALGIWNARKRETIRVDRHLSKGGVGPSKFNQDDALARSLDNSELNTLFEWTEFSRVSGLESYRNWVTLRFWVLGPEGFLARPNEIWGLRLGQVHVLDYPGSLGRTVKLFALEMEKTKGSQDTTIPTRRYALRHRDVRCCPVGALAECLFVLFHSTNKPLDVAKRISASDYAASLEEEDREAVRAAGGDRLMWDWQLRVVCPNKLTNPRVPPTSQTMRNLLRGVRVFEDEKVDVGHALSAKLLHRRQLAVTKSMSLGAAEGDLRSRGGD